MIWVKYRNVVSSCLWHYIVNTIYECCSIEYLIIHLFIRHYLTTNNSAHAHVTLPPYKKHFVTRTHIFV